MNEVEIINRSIKDFFTSPILKLSIIPLILTMLILYIMFFSMASVAIDFIKHTAEISQAGGEVVLDENAPFYITVLTYIVVFIFKYSIVSWLAGFLFYTIGAIFVFKLSVILTLLIISFLTPQIVEILHKKHYSHIELKPFGNISNAITNALKSLFIMVLLYILFIPLYFIPLINIIAVFFPLYYFFHKLLNFDVGSTILSKNEYKAIYKENSLTFRLRTLALYFISMIPFITLFVVVFYVVYLSHAYLLSLENYYKDTKFLEQKNPEIIE